MVRQRKGRRKARTKRKVRRARMARKTTIEKLRVDRRKSDQRNSWEPGGEGLAKRVKDNGSHPNVVQWEACKEWKGGERTKGDRIVQGQVSWRRREQEERRHEGETGRSSRG